MLLFKYKLVLLFLLFNTNLMSQKIRIKIKQHKTNKEITLKYVNNKKDTQYAYTQTIIAMHGLMFDTIPLFHYEDDFNKGIPIRANIMTRSFDSVKMIFNIPSLTTNTTIQYEIMVYNDNKNSTTKITTNPDNCWNFAIKKYSVRKRIILIKI